MTEKFRPKGQTFGPG